MSRIKKAYFAAKYYAKYKQRECLIGKFVRLILTTLLKRAPISKQIRNDLSLSEYEISEAISYIQMHESSEVSNELEKDYFENEVFYNKYSSSRYDTSLEKKKERTWMYSRRYHMGEGCWVNAGVHFLRQHKEGSGILSIGEKCIFAGDNKIDYTGGLIIGNGVVINQGVDILTHGHQYIGERNDYFEESSHGYYSTLTIKDNVMIGANALILPNVREIGENSIVMAGVVVSRPIPANSIVSQNGIKPVPQGLRTLYMYKQNNI